MFARECHDQKQVGKRKLAMSDSSATFRRLSDFIQNEMRDRDDGRARASLIWRLRRRRSAHFE